jgi:hypothetical protein
VCYHEAACFSRVSGGPEVHPRIFEEGRFQSNNISRFYLENMDRHSIRVNNPNEFSGVHIAQLAPYSFPACRIGAESDTACVRAPQRHIESCAFDVECHTSGGRIG